jgi:glycosidase
MNKLKMALTFMLTTRGIPQLYYGTELLMDGDGGHHPNIRLDVPGGWAGDKTNAFTREGRSAEQNDIYDFMSKLLTWRKGEEVIHKGKLTHYIPEDNIYVYFRHSEEKTIMVVMNANPQAKTLDVARFKVNLGNSQQARNIMTKENVNLSSLTLPPATAWVLELK